MRCVFVSVCAQCVCMCICLQQCIADVCAWLLFLIFFTSGSLIHTKKNCQKKFAGAPLRIVDVCAGLLFEVWFCAYITRMCAACVHDVCVFVCACVCVCVRVYMTACVCLCESAVMHIGCVRGVTVF